MSSGQVHPLGQHDLNVIFGDKENFISETIQFKVAPFRTSQRHPWQVDLRKIHGATLLRVPPAQDAKSERHDNNSRQHQEDARSGSRKHGAHRGRTSLSELHVSKISRCSLILLQQRYQSSPGLCRLFSLQRKQKLSKSTQKTQQRGLSSGRPT